MPGQNLTPADIVELTAAFAAFVRETTPQKPLTFVVGRDARVSGDMVGRLVCGTLQGMGVNVIDTGLSTTPTTEMAVTRHHADGGVIITASHNPMQWNALKLLNSKGEFISDGEGHRLQEIAARHDFSYAEATALGQYVTDSHAIDEHIDAVLALPLVNAEAVSRAGFSVILDTVNSTGALALPPLLERLGVKDVTVLNGDPTGIFAHNPEPLPENLHGISEAMSSSSFDVGFVVDPDVDRLAIVEPGGEMFGEEYTLVAVADYILQHTPGNTVSNLSSTRALRDVTARYGGSYSASAVGEVNVVEMMKSTGAVIGGEGNGGVIYPELHYGRDALAGIALFLTYMAVSGKSCSQIRALYPDYRISKNKLQLTGNVNAAAILDRISEQYAKFSPDRTDGVKIDFTDGWVHIRTSNTEPVLRIYAEAGTERKADSMAEEVIGRIRKMM